jgi:hypothetical protein
LRLLTMAGLVAIVSSECLIGASVGSTDGCAVRLRAFAGSAALTTAGTLSATAFRFLGGRL